MKAFLQPLNIPPQEYETLVELARECLANCRAPADDGTVLFRPDGAGHYDAMWTRDFCYMLEGAGKLMDPGEALAAIDYLIAGQREDGAIPDRRQPDGVSVYRAGPVERPLGDECPTDNPQFLVKAVAAYAGLTGDVRAFLDRRDALYRAMDSVPLSPDGLVFVDPNRPHSAYGFTDCIAKTGKVFFSSALYWEACQTLAKLCARAENHDEAHDWYERAERCRPRLGDFWDEDVGMFRAASEDCRQIDLWGSVYASVTRVASKTQARRVGEFFLANWDRCIFNGHLRHLAAREYWQRLLADIGRDRYQNGGYWATPSGWLAQTIALVDNDAARRIISELISDFSEHGVCEWISAEEHVLPGYAASVANVLGAVQPSQKLG
jgi:glycogen debranching enzyme